MTTNILNKFFLAATMLIFLVIFYSTYAYASSNTVGQNAAGEGSGMISGYAVSQIAYQLDADPTKIASISFSLDSVAKNVKIKLSESQLDWYECANTGGNNWMCDTKNATISSADTLRVIATNQ